jgi:hypothetical protein
MDGLEKKNGCRYPDSIRRKAGLSVAIFPVGLIFMSPDGGEQDSLFE